MMMMMMRYRREPIRDTELVYVERSPNYCRANAERGSVGTRHRQCQRGPTANGPDSCHSLCCGRGFTTTEVPARRARSTTSFYTFECRGKIRDKCGRYAANIYSYCC